MRLYRQCMRLCGLCMRLCKGYIDKEKRKMKTCDSHVNEEVNFVTSSVVTQHCKLQFLLGALQVLDHETFSQCPFVVQCLMVCNSFLCRKNVLSIHFFQCPVCCHCCGGAFQKKLKCFCCIPIQIDRKSVV